MGGEIKLPKKENKAHIMETYAEDMVSVISNDKEGLVQRIIHEQEERELEKKNYSPYSKQNRFFLFISLFFLFLAIGLVGYYYFFYKPAQAVRIATPFKSLVLNDSTAFIEIVGLKKAEIAAKIAKQRETTKIKKDQLEGVYFTENKKVIGWTRFNALLKSTILQNKVPVINENFLFGIVSFETEETSTPVPPVPETTTPEQPFSSEGELFDPNFELDLSEPVATEEEIKYTEPVAEPAVDPLRYQPEKPTRKDLFILLAVKSFADVFPVMRGWEGKIFSDLHEVLGINAKGDRSYLFTKEFQDGIVQNKNARILYDNNKNIVLMYVYSDENHVIVASTEQSVKEVIERLIASKVRK
ncbi:MAG: hypothetical protein M3Q34_04560 [bacterium]|nr:hypothetical protein [bacterium]